ncbi:MULTISPECIES: sulfur oxidation c-type cytochrome SoxA [unclassified Polaromonas]|uniref:sulfur oxidation c-type cytochrome SoxA n=1 Tax=unclassified Polaromonas TaxID=2638319 RepID=UPI000F08723C|nr:MULTISPECIES: sulfur oxidation c-type cytochrome SoxA [unclassified Polaromonas]AYQ29764.1 sulfur oxidation c-type cytochrome SoxA [Polaromonas sp. SP1]QGJ19120.1 sulfur oxidation c-type cytochrome SoxA [Polaromonas sp. Pch-P]
MKSSLFGLAALAAIAALPLTAAAQKTTAEGIAEYRAMLADGNPAELYEAKGESLWKEARGPKKASLEKCDLGKGPGVVKGAFVELPRFFADTQRVQDLESRLLTCMEQLQGFNAGEIAKTRFGAGEQKTIESLVAYISGESRDLAFNVPQSHAKEKLMYEVGKKVFYLRGGPYDFSCASCHGEDNKRVRLQDLPNLTKQPGAGVGFGSWPAYRVSSGDLWSMQRRLNDCYRQQRFPFPGYASDATIALGVYMGVNSKAGVSIAPALKR